MYIEWAVVILWETVWRQGDFKTLRTLPCGITSICVEGGERPVPFVNLKARSCRKDGMIKWRLPLSYEPVLKWNGGILTVPKDRDDNSRFPCVRDKTVFAHGIENVKEMTWIYLGRASTGCTGITGLLNYHVLNPGHTDSYVSRVRMKVLDQNTGSRTHYSLFQATEIFCRKMLKNINYKNNHLKSHIYARSNHPFY